jgi:hypothetical protein
MTDNEVEANRILLSRLITEKAGALRLLAVCPYIVDDPVERRVEFSAYLPQFWGKSGLLVDSYQRSGKYGNRSDVAKRLGIPISYVNPEAIIKKSDAFIDCLIDWGYRGDLADLRSDVRGILVPRE